MKFPHFVFADKKNVSSVLVFSSTCFLCVDFISSIDALQKATPCKTSKGNLRY